MTGHARFGALVAAIGILVCASLAAAQQKKKTLTIASWGGAYAQSQQIAYIRPFKKDTGIDITLVYHGGKPALLGKGREYRFGNWDLVDVSADALEAGCRDGLLEPIPKNALTTAKDGTPAAKDFLEGALHECGVGSVAWSSLIVYDKRSFKKKQPSRAADFFDLEQFPGKRALKRSARYTLELALLADGVRPDKIYSELASKAGLARAFKQLESIKDNIVWWNRSDEPLKLLGERKVVMATAFNGRAFGSMISKHRSLDMLWDGQIYTMDSWAIPRSSKNKVAALEFIAFATRPDRLAKQAKWFPYGPVRKSALKLVGNHAEIEMDMLAYLPTNQAHLKRALRVDAKWWMEREQALEAKFSAWLLGKGADAGGSVRTSSADDEKDTTQ